MCGFLFHCSFHRNLIPSTNSLELLSRRGPDSLVTIQKSYLIGTSNPSKAERSGELKVTAVASVLSLRGEAVISQPLYDNETGSLFCWNGEAWKFKGKDVHGNDAKMIFHSLICQMKHAHNELNDPADQYELSAAGIRDVLGSVDGPFSFVFYDARYQRIFYGRDSLGRRSLLQYEHGAEDFLISSVQNGTHDGWQEIGASGISVVNLIESSFLSNRPTPDVINSRMRLPQPSSFPWSDIRAVRISFIN